MSCATSSQCAAVVLRKTWYCENSRRMSVTSPASRSEMMRGAADIVVRSVDKALRVRVLRVHRRIEPVVGNDPVLHRHEQLLAVLVGELQPVGEAAEIVAQRDLVAV